MKYCPDCKAPNPVSRTDCFFCGAPLATPRTGPLPGERAYPCLSCRTEVPYTATVCQGCGRVLTPPPASAEPATEALSPAAIFAMNLVKNAPPPPGWNVEPLPDGTVRLIRGTWKKLRRFAGIGTAFVAIAVMIVFQLAARLPGRALPVLQSPRDESPYGAALLLEAIVGVVLLLFAVWLIWGREELRVGPGLLESRRELGSLRWVRQVTSGVLRVESYRTCTRNGEEIHRRLRVQNLGTTITLDGSDRSVFWGGMMPDEELTALGRYLASVTGWPFVDPEHLRF